MWTKATPQPNHRADLKTCPSATAHKTAGTQTPQDRRFHTREPWFNVVSGVHSVSAVRPTVLLGSSATSTLNSDWAHLLRLCSVSLCFPCRGGGLSSPCFLGVVDRQHVANKFQPDQTFPLRTSSQPRDRDGEISFWMERLVPSPDLGDDKKSCLFKASRSSEHCLSFSSCEDGRLDHSWAYPAVTGLRPVCAPPYAEKRREGEKGTRGSPIRPLCEGSSDGKHGLDAPPKFLNRARCRLNATVLRKRANKGTGKLTATGSSHNAGKVKSANSRSGRQKNCATARGRAKRFRRAAERFRLQDTSFFTDLERSSHAHNFLRATSGRKIRGPNVFPL